MFEDFEVVCPKCHAILRLNSEYYDGMIEETNGDLTSNMNSSEYSFECAKCGTDLKMVIKVSCY